MGYIIGSLDNKPPSKGKSKYIIGNVELPKSKEKKEVSNVKPLPAYNNVNPMSHFMKDAKPASEIVSDKREPIKQPRLLHKEIENVATKAALKGLDIASRPAYATINVIKESQKNKAPGKQWEKPRPATEAFMAGITGKEKPSSLEITGMNKKDAEELKRKIPVAKGAEFVGDIITDPTTYMGIGTAKNILLKTLGKDILKSTGKTSLKDVAKQVGKEEIENIAEREVITLTDLDTFDTALKDAKPVYRAPKEVKPKRLDSYIKPAEPTESIINPFVKENADMMKSAMSPADNKVFKSPINQDMQTFSKPEPNQMMKANMSSVDEMMQSNMLQADDLGFRKIKEEVLKPFQETPQNPFTKVKNERGFSANVRSDTAMNDELRKAFDKNPLTYEPLANTETLSKAQAKMSGGFNKAYSEWNQSIDKFDPSDIPLARMLANQAAQTGDLDTARRIIADVSEKLTQAGQYSQAASILRKSDPGAFTHFVNKQFDKINSQGREIYGKKWQDVILSDDELRVINDSSVLSEDAREKVMEQIYNRVAQTLPSSNMEKFDAWRRMAMLLNPKTHIRNVVGNGIMAGMRKSADTLAAGMEKVFLKPGNRTKSFAWSTDNNIVKAVNDTWNIEQSNLMNNSRWDINNLRVLNRDKRIFKNPVLNKMDNFSKETLEAEDKVFLERAYKDALGGYLKANNLTTATDVAKEYAKRRAFEATFKQANFLSDTINKAKRKKGIGKLVEGAIPFTQTPANIMMRSFEYSPAGIVKALFSRNKGGAQVIEDLSKGLTGTAALGVGYVLASMGAAKGQRSKSSIAAGLESESGSQPYSIVTPWGSYTFDWAQPSAVPLAMGIAIREAIEKKNSGVAEVILDSIIAGGDTLFNMTILKNVKDILGGSGSPTQKIFGIPISYVEQAIPSILGQAAKTIDPIKRNTYDPNPIKKELNVIKSKIPFVSKTLEPQLNVFGQTQSNGGALQQFISPGYAKGKSSDTVTNELNRLYKANKETTFLPKVLDGSFTDKGTEYRLTPKELTAMQKQLGEQTHDKMNTLINAPDFSKLKDDIKIARLRKIVNQTYDKLKADYIKSHK